MISPLKEFSLKFIDVMFGAILGLGLQWWPNLHQPWQYVAFIFAYLYIIDFWIDYGPSLKKFPPKKEIDVMLDVAIVFAMFLLIYSAQLMVWGYILCYTVLILFDYLWLYSSKKEYPVSGSDKRYLDTWMMMHAYEIIISILLVLALRLGFSPMIALVLFLISVILFRVVGSVKYGKLYLR